MKHPTPVVFLILCVTAVFTQAAKFFNLQEDGSILCDTKEDCPDDIPDKANNTVLEFRCAPRVSVDVEQSDESTPSGGSETFVLVDPDFLNQLICGEETMNICCTKFADPEQCEGFDR